MQIRISATKLEWRHAIGSQPLIHSQRLSLIQATATTTANNVRRESSTKRCERLKHTFAGACGGGFSFSAHFSSGVIARAWPLGLRGACVRLLAPIERNRICIVEPMQIPSTAPIEPENNTLALASASHAQLFEGRGARDLRAAFARHGSRPRAKITQAAAAPPRAATPHSLRRRRRRRRFLSTDRSPAPGRRDKAIRLMGSFCVCARV